MTKEQFRQKYNLTLEQFTGEQWIDYDSLIIDEEQLPEGFNPKVSGFLLIPNLKVIPHWFNPVVKLDLRLSSVISFEPTFNPVVLGLSIDSLIEIPFGWKPTVVSLNLPSIVNLPEWFEPTVWRVYFNDGKEYTDKFRPENDFFSWRNGRYIKAVKVCPISEVDKCENNVFHVHNPEYPRMKSVIVYGDGVYVKGKTLIEAEKNLEVKLNTIKTLERYKQYTLETTLKFVEMVAMYAFISREHVANVEHFLKVNKIDEESYTIADFVNLTSLIEELSYGSKKLKDFFFTKDFLPKDW